VTVYADHHTLTSERLHQLQAVARGERPQINRARLRWYLREGYLEPGTADGTRPQFALTDKGWRATGLPRTEVTASSMQAVIFLKERR
jgi:hypothetical protein